MVFCAAGKQLQDYYPLSVYQLLLILDIPIFISLEK